MSQRYDNVPPSVAQLEEWMRAIEGEHLEFKEARNRFSFDDLANYCCAMANEGGGRVVLGVTDRRPRVVVGTQAFPQPEEVRRSLMDRIPLRIDAMDIAHPLGRVLVFEVPSRPIGVPVKSAGVYWSRGADSLVALSEDRLREIFAEAGRDFSAGTCSGATLADLDMTAVEHFRRRWIDKSRNQALGGITAEQLLRDAEVVSDEGVTYAALVLFGTRAALGKCLSQAEVVFEYRSSEVSGPAQQRTEYRQAFFSFYDDLWAEINLRNDVQHYQVGLFVLDIPTFDERSVREAVLNAVSHRNYQLGGSVFVRQYARRLVVESPGGFPPGITADNVLDRQSPRNRRIADVFARCGLVERSGQGMNVMFEQSIRQAKLRPDLNGTDAYQVVLTLSGEVRDPNFLQFIDKLGRETQTAFGTHDLLVLDLVHREQMVPQPLHEHLRRLVDLGAIETLGRGRGTRYLLARRFYVLTGRAGAYTRRRGLDRDQNKELLLKHVRRSGEKGSPMSELQQVLPALSKDQVNGLMDELRRDGLVRLIGARRWAKWAAVGDAVL